MAYYIGIDGGGSTLRLVLMDAAQQRLAYIERKETCNPSIVGRAAATAMIQHEIPALLSAAALDASAVAAVGIGVAGADMFREWLIETVRGALPSVAVAASSDMEIALVGARAERYGVLILAGTGSVAFGINRTGEALKVGGWGYLIGDEGSGYWLGVEALRAVTHAADGRAPLTRLSAAVLETLGLDAPKQLVGWLYQLPANTRNADVARLAHPLMTLAADGDETARAILTRAAQALAAHVTAVRVQLDMQGAPVVFAGGLLEHDTPLQRELCALLHMDAPPTRHYEPVIGAALLAKLMHGT